jgi:hypothetical protein
MIKKKISHFPYPKSYLDYSDVLAQPTKSSENPREVFTVFKVEVKRVFFGITENT